MLRAMLPLSLCLALSGPALCSSVLPTTFGQKFQRPTSRPVPQETTNNTKLPSSAASEDKALEEIHEFIEAEKGTRIKTANKDWKIHLPKPPKLTLSADKDYFWHLATNQGRIKIRLMSEVAPMHVSSTIFLTRVGFYDDLKFHRVIPGFMAQGGCPLGSGTGSPGYKYSGEFDPKVKHDRPGLLSMANAGPGTDGSQFFLTFVPTPHLNNKHTIFGEVVEGMPVVQKLESFGDKNNPSGTPTRPLTIDSATITVAKKKAPTSRAVKPASTDKQEGR